MAAPSCTAMTCIFQVVANAIIFILGVAGNGLVIWIAGFKVKKSVNSTWYLSLAVSDFLFCLFLPLFAIYMVKHDWIFGLFMCKFMVFNMSLNMFSSILLLVIISVDRCVVVMFPVWAQNQRTVRRASVVVMLAWILSAAFSTPQAIFRDIQPYGQNHTKKMCSPTDNNDKQRIATVACSFIFGFSIPFMIIIICYVVIMQKLKANQMAKPKKSFKIMTVLVATFFICWLPFHTIALIELYNKKNGYVLTARVFAIILSSASSALNPYLYAFMGKDIKNQCYALLSKIKDAVEEEEEEEGQYRRTANMTSRGRQTLK